MLGNTKRYTLIKTTTTPPTAEGLMHGCMSFERPIAHVAGDGLSANLRAGRSLPTGVPRAQRRRGAALGAAGSRGARLRSALGATQS